jgi:hypothetical protein
MNRTDPLANPLFEAEGTRRVAPEMRGLCCPKKHLKKRLVGLRGLEYLSLRGYNGGGPDVLR